MGPVEVEVAGHILLLAFGPLPPWDLDCPHCAFLHFFMLELITALARILELCPTRLKMGFLQPSKCRVPWTHPLIPILEGPKVAKFGLIWPNPTDLTIHPPLLG